NIRAMSMEAINRIWGLLLLAVLAGVIPVSARASERLVWDADTVVERLTRQRYVYPQEKLHVVTDKGRYIAGDTVWMRAFVADAASHKPVTESRYVYVELLNQFMGTASRVKILRRDGVYSGYIPLDQDMTEGEYMLVAYTMFAESAGEEYFFKKKLPVISPYFGNASIDADFKTDGDKVKATFTYTDDKGNMKRYNEFHYMTAGGDLYKNLYPGQKARTFSFSQTKDRVVLVTFDGYKKFFTLPGDKDYDITFHPEGGYLIPGASCKVAFKAIGSDGRSVDLSGYIVDDGGNVVTEFKPVHRGMGVFTMVPCKGVKYHAEVTGSDGSVRSFDLPEANDSAAVISVDNRSASLHVSTAGNLPAGSRLLILNRARLAGLYGIEPDRLLMIDKQGLPEGVNQLLLMDSCGNTLSERLVYVRGETERSAVGLVPRLKEYPTRRLAEYTVRLPEWFDRQADMAVSVTDDDIADQENCTDIAVQLLLSSDLQGYIEDPGYYFRDPTRDTDIALDALMMTQGWRRYDIGRSIAGDYQEPTSDLEKGEQFRGTIKSRWRGRPLADATVLIMAPQVGYAATAPTDSAGMFRIDGADFPNGVTYMFQAANRKGDLESNFDVEERVYPEITPFAAENVGQRPMAESADSTMYSGDMDRLRRSIIKGDRWDILLEEITVKARKDRNREPKTMIQVLARYSMDSEQIEQKHVTSLIDAVQRMGPIFMRDGKPYYRQKPVMVYIDLVKYIPIGSDPSEFSGSFGGLSPSARSMSMLAASGAGGLGSYTPGVSLAEVEGVLPFQAIERIDFLQPNEAVMFGQAGYLGGALMITSKDGKGIKDTNWTLKSLMPLGYQKPAEFYSPKYESDNKYDEVPDGMDRRSTVYWNPSVRTDSDGQAKFSFYTTDNPRTTYTVRVEGLTAGGQPFRSQGSLKIRNEQ
ncbi:MAG: hypothetical protein K2L49_02230, partial [Muribaculaceae bacterium]|nr:hypothetical protein [Muribaculaceae bacterium]